MLKVVRLVFPMQRAFVVVLPPVALCFIARKYLVLGGHHVASALVAMWRDVAKCGKGVPGWLSP